MKPALFVMAVFYILTTNACLTNPCLRIDVVTGFRFNYGKLIAFFNHGEILPNDRISISLLPSDLAGLRQYLYRRIRAKKNPEYECLEFILENELSIESPDFKYSTLPTNLNSILDELSLISFVAEITPEPSFRTPRLALHNPEEFDVSSFEGSSRRTSSRSNTSSDEDSDDDTTDDDTLSEVSSRAMTPTPEDLIKLAFGRTPGSPGSSISWDD